MASYTKFSTSEAQNIALGQAGAVFEDSTTVRSGYQIVAIQFLEDSTFTTLTSNGTSFIATGSGSGNDIDTGNTFPQGCTIFGQWTAFTLASGTVIAYFGVF
ncbi:hypothetical protein [Idiomarina abyssalis]|jgi:hypothetical protein|uniref:hypothetical protein n=1 Tax=Idiomarina abyssalis TaxID=86102 RepID=UPI00241C5E45|nr:hypothetical protein [Idiomarina abyssalis]|tara:strand:+ start:1730 stop:2035 length:306 start_codon:yes stop_codon:yes gene_type:complete